MCVHEFGYIYGSQGITFGSLFSPSIVVGSGIELRLSAFEESILNPSKLVSPGFETINRC